MTEVLEKVCGVVGAEAVRLSKYTGRQTVKGVDVIEAASRRVILITAEPAK